MPDLLFQHFWLLLLGMMLVNVAVWRSRLARLVTLGQVSQTEVSRFLRGAVVAVTGYSLAAETIVLVAGWPDDPLCVYSRPWSSPGLLAMLGLTWSCYVLLLWWVWAGGGADTLARLGPALRRRLRTEPYSPTAVRLFITGFLLVVTVGTVVTLTLMAPIPGCAAPAAMGTR
jgi:hypothetical protein